MSPGLSASRIVKRFQGVARTMSNDESSGPIPLTSGSTTVFARVVPTVLVLVLAVMAILAWVGGLGDDLAEPARWTIMGVALVVAVVSQRWFSRVRHVWLDEEHLVVGPDPHRGVRVRLQDVSEVRETRWQKVKWAKVELTRTTPMGDTIRFIPRGREAWLTPWLSSPVVKQLQQRVEAAKGIGPGGAHQPLGPS